MQYKECVTPGLGNSKKRYNAESKKLSNWGGNRIKLTIAAKKYWMHQDTKEYPILMIEEVLIKVQKKMKIDLKEENLEKVMNIEMDLPVLKKSKVEMK